MCARHLSFAHMNGRGSLAGLHGGQDVVLVLRTRTTRGTYSNSRGKRRLCIETAIYSSTNESRAPKKEAPRPTAHNSILTRMDTAAQDGEANDVLIRQLSGLDKMLAIVMSEAALPGTIAVCLCYVFRVQPFALLELTPAAVATGALFALPTVLLDVYLLAVRPRQVRRSKSQRRGEEAGLG